MKRETSVDQMAASALSWNALRAALWKGPSEQTLFLGKSKEPRNLGLGLGSSRETWIDHFSSSSLSFSTCTVKMPIQRFLAAGQSDKHGGLWVHGCGAVEKALPCQEMAFLCSAEMPMYLCCLGAVLRVLCDRAHVCLSSAVGAWRALTTLEPLSTPAPRGCASVEGFVWGECCVLGWEVAAPSRWNTVICDIIKGH